MTLYVDIVFKKNLLTKATPVEFNPHRYMTMPQDGHYTDITSSETPGKPVSYYGVSTTIATQNLKIARRIFHLSDFVHDFAFKRGLHTQDTVWSKEV